MDTCKSELTFHSQTLALSQGMLASHPLAARMRQQYNESAVRYLAGSHERSSTIRSSKTYGSEDPNQDHCSRKE